MRGLFPGTFNPPTIGHREIILRAASVCDHLYIGVGTNTLKESTLFSFNERKAMLEEIIKPLKNVEVITFSGLVADFVKQNRIDVIVRGLRSVSDFDLEREMALANLAMEGVETLFLMAESKHINISSALVREIGKFGHDLTVFVPEEIAGIISQRLSEI